MEATNANIITFSTSQCLKIFPELQSDGPKGPADEVGFPKTEEEGSGFITSLLMWVLHIIILVAEICSLGLVSQSKRSQHRPRVN